MTGYIQGSSSLQQLDTCGDESEHSGVVSTLQSGGLQVRFEGCNNPQQPGSGHIQSVKAVDSNGSHFKPTPFLRFDLVREAVSAVRQIRSDYAIAPGKSIDVVVQSRANAPLFTEHARLIGQLSRSSVHVGAPQSDAAAAHSLLSDGSEIIVALGGIVDVGKECGKLRGELEQLEIQLDNLSKRLRNEGFISRAPANVVESERKKEEEWIKRRGQLAAKVKTLCGG